MPPTAGAVDNEVVDGSHAGRDAGVTALRGDTRMTPDDLVEVELIHQLKYRYVRYIDTKDWEPLAELFTDDATASYGGGARNLAGRAAILEFLTSSMASESMLTSHKVHHPEITLTGPDDATGVWALDDVVIMDDAGLVVRGSSFYDDHYTRVEGTWRIAHTGYRRVYEEIEPRSPEAKLTASWWATGGRSSLL